MADLLPLAITLTLLTLKSAAATEFRPTPTACLATLAIALAIAAVLVLLPRASRIYAAILVNGALSFVLLIDQIHTRFFHEPASIAELRDAWQLPSVTTTILSTVRPADLWLIVDIPVLLVVAAIYRSRRHATEAAAPRVRWKWSLALLTGVLVASPVPALTVIQDRNHAFEWRASPSEQVAAVGILPYHLFDLSAHAATLWNRVGVTTEERNEVAQFLTRRRQEAAAVSPLFGKAAGMNLIIVQAESLQAFPVGLKIDGRPVTPNLDAFSAESLRFVNFHEQTYLGATSDGIFVALQSLHPLPPGEGAISTRYLTNGYRGLPTILAEHGYKTMAAMGAPGRFWRIDHLWDRLGFQQTVYDDGYPGSERFGQGVADGDFFQQTAPMLVAQQSPFMAFLLTVSNHKPHELPLKHRTLPLGSLAGTGLGKYLESVHYFDSSFGAFLADLQRTGLLERSVVVVYGDHQAWLDDSPELAALLGFNPSNRQKFWEVRKRVPLLVRLPHAFAAGVLAKNGGHLDIAPTLLGLLGLRAESDVMLGSDLMRNGDGPTVFRDSSFASGGSYFVAAPQFGDRSTCFASEGTRPVDCAPLEPMHRAVLEQLRVSDIIVRGDMVPELTPHSASPKQ